MSKKSENNNMGFVGWLTLSFIILRLTGFIDWSWWLVFSPLMISIFLGVLLITLQRSYDRNPATGADLKRAFKILDRMEKNEYK